VRRKEGAYIKFRVGKGQGGNILGEEIDVSLVIQSMAK
jgi:hypothetical protein